MRDTDCPGALHMVPATRWILPRIFVIGQIVSIYMLLLHVRPMNTACACLHAHVPPTLESLDLVYSAQRRQLIIHNACHLWSHSRGVFI